MSFLKKTWPFVSVAVLVSIGGFIFGRSYAPSSSIKVYKAPDLQKDAQGYQVPAETQPTDRRAGLENASGPVHPHQAGKHQKGEGLLSEILREKRDLTAVEKHLLEAGYDLSKLPRDANGELLRGPTGGVALVRNGRAPTEREILRLERERRLRERRSEIMETLTKFSDRDISNEEFLKVLDLQEEYSRIDEELGIHSNGRDVSAHLEYFRFMATHSTEDGRIPTVHAARYLQLIENVGSESPEIHALLDRFRAIVKTAIKNGETYFQPRIDSQ